MAQPEYPNQTRTEPVMGSGGCGGSLDEYSRMEGGLGSTLIIDAMPLSMVPAEDDFPEPTPKVAKRRNMEEMAMRPDWLPEDWRIDLRVRTSGVSAGLIDRYFFDPSGRKFRSKHEVLHFLETGTRLKRSADAVPCHQMDVTLEPTRNGELVTLAHSRSFPDWTYNIQIVALQTLAFIQSSMSLTGHYKGDPPNNIHATTYTARKIVSYPTSSVGGKR